MLKGRKWAKKESPKKLKIESWEARVEDQNQLNGKLAMNTIKAVSGRKAGLSIVIVFSENMSQRLNYFSQIIFYTRLYIFQDKINSKWNQWDSHKNINYLFFYQSFKMLFLYTTGNVA